ncbi:MAG TPA: DUF805 domain-containing protein [Methyloceanibacter sp.]|jgi:uncharacterized membrane protein YhaH (DUF805 family)|nr:DUF805 domain-containing protein [Methyloceanibacter sp.]
MDVDFASLLLSRDGRINRAKFWIGAVGFLVILIIVDVIFGSSIFGRILKFLIAIALFYPAYAVAAKRFQDRNKPGETALYGLVPVFVAILLDCFGLTGDATGATAIGWICRLIYLGVGLWFAIELGTLKGTPGPNRFGGDPLAAVR